MGMASGAKGSIKRTPWPGTQEGSFPIFPGAGALAFGSAGFGLLGRKGLEGEAQQLPNARVLLLRVAPEHRALVGPEPHRDLAVRVALGPAALEVELLDRQANDLARRLEAVLAPVALDPRDQGDRQ